MHAAGARACGAGSGQRLTSGTADIVGHTAHLSKQCWARFPSVWVFGFLFGSALRLLWQHVVVARGRCGRMWG